MKWLQKKQNAVKANNTTNKLAMAVSISKLWFNACVQKHNMALK
jgi:hypothetical protein